MLCFVYGTLLPGYGNHRVMQAGRGKFVSKAVLWGYEMFTFGMFPGIRKTNDGSSVLGEVWDVEDIRPLDRLEDYREESPDDSFYKRTIVDVDVFPETWGNDSTVKVSTYVPCGDCSVYRKIASGDWRNQ